MTVSELQLEIERGLWDDSTSLAQIERVQLRLYDLIADWKAMRNVLVELVDTDSDRAFERCALALNTLNLKP